MRPAPARPHIVIDARMACDGGIGTYIQNLVPRVAAERPHWSFTLLARTALAQPFEWEKLLNVRVRSARTRIYGVAEQIEVAWAGRRADLLWSPHYNFPLLARAPIVVTVHDVNHLALPEMAPGVLRQTYARGMFNAVRRRAAGMLFISEFSRCEMERLVGVIPAETRTKVTPLAADDTWRRARELAPQRPVADPYFIYVGNLKQHKNVPLLLRAFARAAKLIPHRLVIVGRRKGLRADPAIDAALRSHGNRVTYVGEIPIAALWGFVAHAEALVTASLYEGFGLPPLEAMAAGCPCIVSTSGALPEVCGDAALYSDPRDEEKLAEQMVTVATDPRVRGRLVEAGRRRAAEFSWDRCAAATIEVLESALARA